MPMAMPGTTTSRSFSVVNKEQSQQMVQSSQFLPMTELYHLSASLTAFQGCFDDLQCRLNSLRSAVDSLIMVLPQHNSGIMHDPSVKDSIPPVETRSTCQINERAQEPREVLCPQLESLCRSLDDKGLRRYLVGNLKDRDRLLEQVPIALKNVCDPASFVIDCVGKFFVQGSKTFANKDSPAVAGREASILMLECFLLMGNGDNGDEIVIKKAEKEEANSRALLWRKRMVNEGGVGKASEVDARGLLLWISCFGLPASFKYADVGDLLCASNAREFSAVLRRSSALMAKVPAIVEEMIKNKREVDAVDIAYSFGLEDKFNPQMLLTSFLNESKESWLKAKKEASPAARNEARKKQLAALKSVIKCLEGHKIDPSKLLPGWRLGQQILDLEKVIADNDKKKGMEKTPNKRKADEEQPTKQLRPQEGKRAHYTVQGLQKQHMAVGHVDSQRSVFESGFVNHYDPSRRCISQSGNLNVWNRDPALTVGLRHTGLLSSSSLNALYRPTAFLEGYSTVPNTLPSGLSSHDASADLYKFADRVHETEYQPPGVLSAALRHPN